MMLCQCVFTLPIQFLLFCHLTFHCKCAFDEQKKKTAFIDGEISSPVSPSDTCERQTGIQRSISTPSLTSKHRGGTAEHTTLSDLFEDRLSDRRPQVHNRLQHMRPASTKSCLVNHSKEQVRKKESRTIYSSLSLQSQLSHKIISIVQTSWLNRIIHPKMTHPHAA